MSEQDSKTVQKWGFGMAPLTKATRDRNIHAVVTVESFVRGSGLTAADNLINQISWLKGMFNRIVRQNQWDWFTVNVYFDYPSRKNLSAIVNALNSLREAIKNKDEMLGRAAIKKLSENNFLRYCDNYIAYNPNEETKAEYLYILSRREEPDVLKIGMTTRNVPKRVSEINSATGVLYPYSARKVYKVKDSAKVEGAIHSLLQKYRIRQDREFFKISYHDACCVIENYLSTNDQYYYD